MPDPESNPQAERAQPTGSWRPSGGTPPPARDDSPTVRSSGQRGSGSHGSGTGSSSGSRRAGLALPMPVPGDRLESFELHEAIGVGGMGAVFLATDIRLHRQVALKILPPEQSGDAETVQRFYQEGRSAARLDHENIARVFTIGADKGYHFIAFEYIEGATIRQQAERDGPLPVAEVINYTLQIANALVHASERGVVHRDIKPSNIIVTPQGRAKLVDMGLARRFERGASDDGLTQSGMTLGTFDYISPEQASDPRDVDVRSDLYSLGCTIFYMLTGRPPFPEGTILQKLLHHRDEPAPDVRTIRPDVPADLSAVILKLMEKDRDRRYQTPEQLVRDLLGLAGTLGLRSVSPEGLVWMSNTPAPAWERHLVWGLPAIGLMLVVSALVFWGQPGEEPPSASSEPIAAGTATDPAVAVNPPPSVVTVAPPAVTAQAPTIVPPAARETPRPETQSPAPAREIPVGSGEDLAAILARAPSGSTLILTDDGPYNLRAAPERRADEASPSGRDRAITIKADANARPVLRMARRGVLSGAEPPGDGEDAILAFRGGRVALEGLEFQLDDGRGESLAAIVAEDVDLSLTRCLFRRTAPSSALVAMTALELRSSRAPGEDDDRPAPTRVLSCHFDGGQAGIHAVGPADVSLRDCTFGAAEPAVWLDNGSAESPVPVDLTLRFVSVQAGPAPVFRLARTAARITVEDSVFAPAGAGDATLVATDAPDRLDWHGRDNLYGRVAAYLQPSGDVATGRPTIRAFSAWADGPHAIREFRSLTSRDPVWAPAEGADGATAGLDPSSVFRLAGTPGLFPNIPGARRGPRGPIARPVKMLATLLGSIDLSRPVGPFSFPTRADGPKAGNRPVLSTSSIPGEPQTRDDETGRSSGRMELAQGDPMPAPGDELSPMGTSPNAPMGTSPTEPMSVAPIAPMPVAPAEPDRDGPSNRVRDPRGVLTGLVGSEPSREVASGRPTAPKTAPPERVGPPAELAGAPAEPDDENPNLIRTGEGFRNALAQAQAQLGSRGAVLRLAPGADIELSGIEIARGGRLVVQAEPGERRPRIRLRRQPDMARGASEPALLFRLAPGAALELQGIDVVLDGDDSAARPRRAAFGVGPGTDLALTRCTVTIAGPAAQDDPLRSAMALVQAEGGVADASAATVRISESLLRGAGDLLDVAAGRRLDLTLTNCVAACGGSLVHGHGLARGHTAEPIKLTLRQVTARAEGGLIRLESSPGEPELPVAEVIARDSILATTPDGSPLCLVEGQDGLDALRDRIQWESHGLVYHQIETYRRDQTAQSGTSPVGFRRSSWEVAVGPREDTPLHGDARFLNAWGSGRAIWTATADDMRLAPDSPAFEAGPDLWLIPEAPASDEL